MVIERFFSRIPEKDAVFCNWNTSWWKLKDMLLDEMKKRNVRQGDLYCYRKGPSLRNGIRRKMIWQSERKLRISGHTAENGISISESFCLPVILIYVIVELVVSVTNRATTYYEVGQGSIIKNVSYTGFAVRTEQTVEAPKSGYLNFYQPEESKISAGQSVCAVSDKKLDLSNREEETGEAQLTEDEQRTASVFGPHICEQLQGGIFFRDVLLEKYDTESA